MRGGSGAGEVSFIAAGVDFPAGLSAGRTADHISAETVGIASIWRQAKRAAS